MRLSTRNTLFPVGVIINYSHVSGVRGALGLHTFVRSFSTSWNPFNAENDTLELFNSTKAHARSYIDVCLETFLHYLLALLTPHIGE